MHVIENSGDTQPAGCSSLSYIFACMNEFLPGNNLSPGIVVRFSVMIVNLRRIIH